MSKHTLQSRVVLRPAAETDRAAIEALAGREVAAASNVNAVAYFMRLAFDGKSNESRVIVADDDGAVVGFVLFGSVAGALGTGRVHFVAVATTSRRNSLGGTLCRAAIAELESHGARLVLVEIADDAWSSSGRALLLRCGFAETARVADYYRDGVDLVVLERPIDRAH